MRVGIVFLSCSILARDALLDACSLRPTLRNLILCGSERADSRIARTCRGIR